MKKIFSTIFVAAAALCLFSCAEDFDGKGSNDNGQAVLKVGNHTQTFPGAEGGAGAILGGAGGTVYTVTTLEDDVKNTGSLRYAINQTGVRTIVFNVSGVIELKEPLDIVSGGLTIAGQTAPEGGITLSAFPVTIKASNVVLRYLRFRMGSSKIGSSKFVAEDGDALGAKDVRNIMIDHCSMSWSTDECASFSRVRNFTLQYCIISESLKMAGHQKGNHGYGGIWGGVNATYHHNLLADHDSRNPRFDHEYVGGAFRGPIDYFNNVVYNWGSNSTYGGEVKEGGAPFYINMQNNYYKAGTTSKHAGRLLDLTHSCENCGTPSSPGKFFISGNMVNGTAADWSAVENTTPELLAFSTLSQRYVTGLTQPNNMEAADDAYQSVIKFSGASYDRDAVDTRVLNGVINGTGKIINDETEVGGLPAIPSVSRAADFDTDGDGMPDAWETANGLNPNNAQDGKQYILSAKYTNLEIYLNELVVATFPENSGANATR
ncbi:MAG: pectate lyase [Prevotella sp.]|nr:pectate lyase [Candidatus Prevotella equi]